MAAGFFVVCDFQNDSAKMETLEQSVVSTHNPTQSRLPLLWELLKIQHKSCFLRHDGFSGGIDKDGSI